MHPDDLPIAEQLAALRQAVRSRDEFLAVAAHELRNPMHALMLQLAAAAALARRNGATELVERLDATRLTAERFVRRATVLLDVSRLNAGRFQPQREPVDLAALAQAAVEDWRAEADVHQAPLTLRLPRQALVGRWDRVAIEQVADNLLSNALRYGAGSPVRVSVGRIGRWARLVVRDRGMGIATADQRRIFEPFEQVISAGADRGGFGVGLWLVRSLVDAHGGRIEVASIPGRGTVFAVRLPLQDAT